MPRSPRTATRPAGPLLVPGRPPAWRRRLLRHRRPLAAALAALLVWSVVSALQPPDAATTSVLAAARDLPAGTVLAADDLVLRAVVAQAMPADAVATGSDLSSVVGRTVVVPVRAGEPVRSRDLLGATLLQGYGAGTVATPVRLSDDAAAAVVRPGDLVDVVAAVAGGVDGVASGSRALVVASRVRVLLAGAGAASAGGGPLSLSASGDRSAAVVVLATTPEQGLAIARAAVGSRLSVVLRAG